MADRLKGMAGKAAEKIGGSGKAKEATEAAGEKLKRATGGKHADKIEKGEQMLRERMEKQGKDASPER